MFHILNFQCTFTDILAFLSPLTTHLLPLKTKQAELAKVEFFIKNVAKLIIFTEIKASINDFISLMQHSIGLNNIFTPSCLSCTPNPDTHRAELAGTQFNLG